MHARMHAHTHTHTRTHAHAHTHTHTYQCHCQVSLVLEHGIGVSLINSVAEELLFATFTGIRVMWLQLLFFQFIDIRCDLAPLLQVDFVNSSTHQCLNAIVQHIQVGLSLACSDLLCPLCFAARPHSWRRGSEHARLGGHVNTVALPCKIGSTNQFAQLDKLVCLFIL